MTLERIYICRHGYRMNWLPEPHPPNPTGIDSDPPLAPHGVDQAHELAAHIQQMPDYERPQFIISSPFYRCVETAGPVSKKLGINVALDRGIGEYYKVGREVIPEPSNYDLLQGFFGDFLVEESEWPRDTAVGVIPSPEGETPETIFERCQRFWSQFIPVFEEKFPNIKNVLIVTHAATAIALGMTLTGRSSVLDSIDGQENNFIRAGACSMSSYVHQGDHWSLVKNGDTSFLKDGEEMNWNFHSGFEAGSDEDIKSRQKKEETEDFYVVVEVPNMSKRFDEDHNDEVEIGKTRLIKPSSHFQVTELNHDHPFFKISNNLSTTSRQPGKSKGADVASQIIDGKIYPTRWAEIIGTDMFFDDSGELLAMCKEHLQVDESIIVDTKDTKVEAEISEKPTRNPEDEQPRSQFLRKAIRQSKTIAPQRRMRVSQTEGAGDQDVAGEAVQDHSMGDDDADGNNGGPIQGEENPRYPNGEPEPMEVDG